MTIGYLNEAREEVTTVAYNAKTIRNRNYPVAKMDSFVNILDMYFHVMEKYIHLMEIF